MRVGADRLVTGEVSAVGWTTGRLVTGEVSVSVWTTRALEESGLRAAGDMQGRKSKITKRFRRKLHKQ